MKRVFLFLSIGRCGTQWLASHLTSAYADEAAVTHEPIGPFYRPRSFFRAYDRIDDMLLIDEIREHLDEVERITSEWTYIETGWPSYAAMPLFHRRFGDRLSIVQLVRNPVTTAMSLAAIGAFDGRDDEWHRNAFLDPSVPGVIQGDYASRWPSLTPYEKSLFGWTEIHMYAHELRTRLAGCSFHLVRFEDLFGGRDELPKLLRFMELQPVPELLQSAVTPIDAYRSQDPGLPDWRLIYDHPATVTLASSFGYDLDSLDANALRERYEGPLPTWRVKAPDNASASRKTLSEIEAVEATETRVNLPEKQERNGSD
jgi:hypothetical protein